MAQSSRRRSTVKDAIDDILRRLSALPSSAELLAVRGRCEDAARESETWTESQPPRKAKEELMRRMLDLHHEVARLEREAKT
jgi:hypothetical protein